MNGPISLSNLTAERYYSSSDHLDSTVVDLGLTGKTKHEFSYNTSGDIIKIKKSKMSRFNTETWEDSEFQYDNNPNPFNLLFKKTGILVSRLQNFNFSAHNPVSVKRKSNLFGESKSTIHYEYNNFGLPVKITFDKGQGDFEQVMVIKYQ